MTYFLRQRTKLGSLTDGILSDMVKSSLTAVLSGGVEVEQRWFNGSMIEAFFISHYKVHLPTLFGTLSCIKKLLKSV